MKYRGVIVVVEGQTEEEFVNESLRPWLNSQSVFDVRAIKIRSSRDAKGGNIGYQKFKNDVTRLLKHEKDVLVTSLIDFFRLPPSFPQYDEARKITDKVKKVEFLENAIAADIDSQRFIPYIQMHEFEALLYTNVEGFKFLPELDLRQIIEIEAIIQKFPNPEQINDHPETAPSKRLKKIYPGYKKVLHGNFIIMENTFSALLEKCPRFRHWATSIVSRMKSSI